MTHAVEKSKEPACADLSAGVHAQAEGFGGQAKL